MAKRKATPKESGLDIKPKDLPVPESIFGEEPPETPVEVIQNETSLTDSVDNIITVCLNSDTNARENTVIMLSPHDVIPDVTDVYKGFSVEYKPFVPKGTVMTRRVSA